MKTDPRHPPTPSGMDATDLDLLFSPEITQVAQRILDELGADHASLLSRWLAFRIAELMDIAEQATDPAARSAAADSCVDLILRVWQERSHWPAGWPPASARRIVDAIRPAETLWDRPSLPETSAELSWLRTLPIVVESLERERDAWLRAALADEEAADIRQWLRDAGALLSEREREILEGLAQAIEAAEDDLIARISRSVLRSDDIHSEDEPAERADAVLKVLRKTTRSRLELAKRVADTIKDRQGQPEGVK